MADATAVTNLDTAIEQITAQIADVTANPKPDYSVGGQSVSWAAYLNVLKSSLKELIEARALLSGPYEYRSAGVS